jgi:hypothetical protein
MPPANVPTHVANTNAKRMTRCGTDIEVTCWNRAENHFILQNDDDVVQCDFHGFDASIDPSPAAAD